MTGVLVIPYPETASLPLENDGKGRLTFLGTVQDADVNDESFATFAAGFFIPWELETQVSKKGRS